MKQNERSGALRPRRYHHHHHTTGVIVTIAVSVAVLVLAGGFVTSLTVVAAAAQAGTAAVTVAEPSGGIDTSRQTAVAKESAAASATDSAATPPPPPQRSQRDAAADERLAFFADERGTTEAEAPGIAGLLIRTLGALLLIVGLIVAAAWGLQRFNRARYDGLHQDKPQLAVLTTLSLGERRLLSAVRFGDKTLLIGSTPQAITLLAAEDQAERDLLTAEHDALPATRSVADMLQQNNSVNRFDDELSGATDRYLERERWKNRGDA